MTKGPGEKGRTISDEGDRTGNKPNEFERSPSQITIDQINFIN